MIYKAYSVFDKAVGAFLPVFFVRSRGEALRSFSQAANDGQHQFAKNMGDYTLYEVGAFDDTTGLLESKDPERVASALEVQVIQ